MGLETICWSVTFRDAHCGCFFPQHLMAVGHKEFMDHNYPEDHHTIVPLVEKALVVPKADLQKFIDQLNQDLGRLQIGEEAFKKEGALESEKSMRYQKNVLALVVLGLQEILRSNTFPNPESE